MRDPETTWSPSQFAAQEAEFVGWFQEWEDASALDIQWLSACPAPVVDSEGKDDYRGADQKVVFRFFIDTNEHLPVGTEILPDSDCTGTVGGTNWGAFPWEETGSPKLKRCPFNGKLLAGSSKNKSLHELGHKLAFNHEHQRPDAVGQGCDPSGGSTSTYLTYFDADSVMGYEPCANSEGDEGLSVGDQLGAEILYPWSFEPEIWGAHCFGLVCREGGQTFTTAWRHRGASDFVLNGTQWWNGSWVSGQELNATLSHGEHSIKVTFDDQLDREHFAAHTVLADDAIHTAIALSML